MFQGSTVALITPFLNDHIDEPALAHLLNWHIEEGTDAVVVCGSTGESMLMNADEQAQVIEQSVATMSKRIPVIAGTAAIDTRQTVYLTQQAERLGADAALIVIPPYIKPSQVAIYHHFRTIAENTSLPIIIYNNPGRSIVNVCVTTVERLAEIPNIIGLKDSTPHIERTTYLRRTLGPEFLLVSGEDTTVAGYLAQGGDGWISVIGNAAPRLCANFVAAWKAGDMAKFATYRNQLDLLQNAVLLETNPCGIKYAVSLLGKCLPHLRAPLMQVSENTQNQVRQTMQQLGLIA